MSAVRPSEERLGDAVELLAESVRRLLANRSHAVLELARPRLAASVDLACGRPLELLHLAAFELGECELDPRARLALGTVDLLAHGVLVLAQALVELVDGPAPVVGLGLELLERSRERVARARLELLTQANGRGALLVDGRVELVRLGRDLRLDVRDALAHRCSSVETAPWRAFWARSRSDSQARRRSSTRCSTAATSSAMRSDSSRSRTASSPRR